MKLKKIKLDKIYIPRAAKKKNKELNILSLLWIVTRKMICKLILKNGR